MTPRKLRRLRNCALLLGILAVCFLALRIIDGGETSVWRFPFLLCWLFSMLLGAYCLDRKRGFRGVSLDEDDNAVLRPATAYDDLPIQTLLNARRDEQQFTARAYCHTVLLALRVPRVRYLYQLDMDLLPPSDGELRLFNDAPPVQLRKGRRLFLTLRVKVEDGRVVTVRSSTAPLMYPFRQPQQTWVDPERCCPANTREAIADVLEPHAAEWSIQAGSYRYDDRPRYCTVFCRMIPDRDGILQWDGFAPVPLRKGCAIRLYFEVDQYSRIRLMRPVTLLQALLLPRESEWVRTERQQLRESTE